MGRRLASLDCYHPEAVDLWAARLGNSMAAQQWTTLGLQKIRRVFRQRRSTQVAVPPQPKIAGFHSGCLSNPGAAPWPADPFPAILRGQAPGEVHADNIGSNHCEDVPNSDTPRLDRVQEI